MTTTKKKGRRLGSLQLGRRCKHAAAELGPIHEARNVQTGAPALVMMPGSRPNWGPKKNWQVRVSFQVTPPFIVLEIEQAPASGRLSDLANLLVLLLAGLDAVGSNARMRAHLTRTPMERWARHPPLKVLAAAGLVVLALAGGFWLGTGTRPMESPTPPRPAPVLGELADAGVSSSFLIDGAEQGPAGIAYPLPDKPFSNQAKPPCLTRRDEVAINGGCWVALERRPPCHEEQAEYKGKCYLPVSSNRGPRLPQSVSP
ncbi:hypothetical protein [Vitiosangium sp. GDMCC 1.1324]|uniref:hypothetical protein n=1 Tax=Vitiosangium sp. (strain GDMCC 1.1324) TaxID=2138576 RepID=UPI000D3C493D|nr:hypothetical protein [Vitiosangium sp. GDMCC 1.1324]PTL79758.1 hypothetical protein DAT35_33720 [Vitiosangium sp. GDMCC 1.1324]